jgi:hypothetical protein
MLSVSLSRYQEPIKEPFDRILGGHDGYGGTILFLRNEEI